MRYPIQLFLPQVSENLEIAGIRRDAQRVMDAWRFESTIWLMPGLEGPVRWREGPFWKLLAIGAERMDRIDVLHIGKNGQVWGPGADRLPHGRVDGLLETWLRMSVGSIRLSLTPHKAGVRIPRIQDGRMTGYQHAEMHLRPFSVWPIRSHDDKGSSVNLAWPPKGWPATVSPDSESRDHYGPLSWRCRRGVPVVVSERDRNMCSLPLTLLWPPPFDVLIPRGAGLDEMLAHHRMVQIAEMSKKDRRGARAAVSHEARSYVFDGISSRELAWFWPTYAKDGEMSVLADTEARYAIEAESVNELLTIRKARAMLSEGVDVRRTWGIRGLLFALLGEILDAGQRFIRCNSCEQIIRGSANKIYCSREENDDCFKSRQRNYKRAQRA